MLRSRVQVLVAFFGCAAACGGCILGSYGDEGAGGGGSSSTGGSGGDSTGTTGMGGSTGGSGGDSTGTAGTGGSTGPTKCGSAAECDDSNPCTADDCPSGECTNAPTNEGMPQNDVDLNDCKKPVCQGGQLVNQADPAQLPAVNQECVQPACNGTEPGTTPKDENQPCGQVPTEPCLERVCKSGICSTQNKPDMFVMAGDVLDCRDTHCQEGAIALIPNNRHCPDLLPNDCSQPACNAQGVCGEAPAPQGTSCDSNFDGLLDGVCTGASTICSQ